MSLKDFFGMVRPLNCAMAALGTFIGYCVASGLIQFQLGIGIAMLVAFLVCGGGMAINDFFDRAVDKKLHPEKPLPSGRASPMAVMAFSFVLFLLGNGLAFYYLPKAAFLIAAGFTFLLILYSAFLAKVKYLGNVVVALGTAFTLVFGASLVASYYIVVFLAAAAFFANMARELIKDLQDARADKGSKLSLPMLLPQQRVTQLVFLYYAIAIVLVYVPVVLGIFGNIYFLLLVSFANIGFVFSALSLRKQCFGKAQAASKAAMLPALIGFLAGVL